MSDLRCIIVSGERFEFSRDQLESDPDNYFATYFFGGFSEGSQGKKELVIQKDAQLFKLIQAHLRGYEVFPLPDAAIPPYMTREGAVANLLREAQFYGLARFEERIQEVIEEAATQSRVATDSSNARPKRYKFSVGDTRL